MITYKFKKPTLKEFIKLRNAVNWNLEEKGISDERALKSLENSPFCVCAYDKNKIIGMVRMSGDKEMYGYIQDTIVLPAYQGKGVGSEMVKKLIEPVKNLEGYLIGLCPSKISVNFYEKLGFKKREGQNPFMYKEVKPKK